MGHDLYKALIESCLYLYSSWHKLVRKLNVKGKVQRHSCDGTTLLHCYDRSMPVLVLSFMVLTSTESTWLIIRDGRMEVGEEYVSSLSSW